MSAYNASKTIKYSIESVIKQSYENWELVIIDDKSIDDTISIIKSFQDSRIKLITHDENLGAGLARRTGVKSASGDYIFFLDSDDYIAEDCLETLNFATKVVDADIINQGLHIVDESGKILQSRVPDFCIEQGGSKFNHGTHDTKRYMHGMLFKKSLFDKVEYSSRRYIEDTPTLVQLLYFANKVFNLDYAGYYYVQNSSSLTHKAGIIKNFIYQALCVKDINDFFTQVNHLELVNTSHFLTLCSYIKNNISKNDEYLYKKELDELQQYSKYINDDTTNTTIN